MQSRPQVLTPFQVSVHRLPEFTSVKVAGPASLENFVQLIANVGKVSRQRGDKRVLVDLLAVEGDLKFTDHFQMGEHVAEALAHLDKLASVVPEGKATHTTEKVALMKGVQLRVFTSMNDAIHWLSQGQAPRRGPAEKTTRPA